MEDILYLVHRIPYPPNKGDKIRSFNILRFLSEHYRVHLGTFVDDPDDLKFVDELRQWAHDVKIIQVSPLKRKLASIFGLVTGEALSNRFYASPEMQCWVDQKIYEQGIKRVLLFSSPMAQFVGGGKKKDTYADIHRVMDFVDVDSEKWFQYADNHRFPMSWLYQREGVTLRGFECAVAEQFAASVFVSENEARLFKNIAVNSADKIVHVLNGVDTQAFDPARPWLNPFSSDEQAVVFTGAMDYWANVEAVTWFAKEVWPAVRVKCPKAVFYIVGAKPSESVQELAKLPQIVVTGAVPEVKPYVRHACICVAPLRIARGIQNKVLEALAMEKVVVATPEAMEGISGFDDDTDLALVTGQRLVMADTIISELENDCPRAVESSRRYVEKHFSWNSHLTNLLEILKRKGCSGCNEH
ncbi:MAG: TIGR03087 family PEP-CTERM/XrtA system glycosyltransferase [Hahellaceae bacterium]|nr:TIGR03087 family PEP-CTERM/XrtA system glycosyltransferase [Hahellaceae bacterium]